VLGKEGTQISSISSSAYLGINGVIIDRGAGAVVIGDSGVTVNVNSARTNTVGVNGNIGTIGIDIEGAGSHGVYF